MDKELLSTINADAAKEIYDFYIQNPNPKKYKRIDFIKELMGRYDDLHINKMCEIFEISRSGFYKKKVHKPKSKLSDATIYRYIKKIRKIKFGSVLGCKKIAAKLNNEYHDKLKEKVTDYRVYKILKERNDLSTSLKNKYIYHMSRSKFYPYLDLLEQQDRYYVDHEFQILLTDSTEIMCSDCKMYLIVIIDLYGRRVIGHCLTDHLNYKAYDTAFTMALEKRKDSKAYTILHGDRGTLNTCKQVRNLAKDNNVRLSYSRRATPEDNAPNESFFSSLKDELLNVNYLFSSDELEYQFNRYLYFYHNERPHSSLDYLTPLEFIKKGHNNEQKNS